MTSIMSPRNPPEKQVVRRLRRRKFWVDTESNFTRTQPWQARYGSNRSNGKLRQGGKKQKVFPVKDLGMIQTLSQQPAFRKLLPVANLSSGKGSAGN